LGGITIFERKTTVAGLSKVDQYAVYGVAMKQTLQLGAFSAANVLSAILFQWLLLTLLGPGQETDALFAAMTVPMLFATVISSSLTQVLVPLFSGETAEQQHRDAWSLLNLCALMFLALGSVLALTAPFWTPLTVLGFTPESKALTIVLSQISIIGMIFTGINSVQIALAFARNRYIWADVAAVIANVIALVLLFMLLPIYGVYAAAWITVARLLMQTVLLMRGIGRWSALDRRAPIFHEAWLRIRPMLIGSTYYKMDPLLDRFLLSSMAPGSISLLYLAQQLYGAGSQIVTKAFAVPAITRLSVAYKQGNETGFSRDLRKTLFWMAGVTISAIVGIALIGLPILRVVMEHGAFTASDSRILWLLLLLISGQLVAGCLGSLAAGAFYAQGDTKTPTWLGSISFTISILLKIALFHWFGLYGLAVAISIYYCQSLIFMLIALYRRGHLTEQMPRTPH
jgi:putative peptidoglycan lipid II flippase